MAITGVETLTYSVTDVATSARFFSDFGLNCVERSDERAAFVLPEGSSLTLLQKGHAGLPAASRIEGDGAHEVIWAVDSQVSLDRLAAGLAADRAVTRDADGTVRFVADFGVAMGLRVFARTPIVCAPDPVNAPGHTRRLNQHRKWRLRARPKGIAHVVFAVPDYEEGAAFMRERLGFRLSDSQRGFGKYLRAPGSNNHHTLLLLNANAPVPGMDGRRSFHHANFVVEDLDEIMVGANYMPRRGWAGSHFGLGRHRIDSALFYYIPCPAGGEAEYGADSDCVDDGWVPRDWVEPLFAYAHFVHDLPPFMANAPAWKLEYLTDEAAPEEAGTR
jgi:catechol 2,3-dioxygenase-like lactoylglutathione lyase family enzyme